MTARWLTLATVLAFAGSAAGQSDSHVPIPRVDDVDPARLFEEKIRQSKLSTDIGALMKQFRGSGFDMGSLNRLLEANPELKQRALEAIKGIDLEDPKYRGLIDEVVRRNGGRINPDVVKQQLQNLQRSSDDGATNAGQPDSASRGPQTGNRGTQSGRSPQPPVEPKPRDPEEEAARQAWARDIAEWANRFPKDKLAGPLRDSQALQGLLTDIAKASRSATAGGADGIDVQLARLQKQWESAKSWLPADWVNSWNFTLPEFGDGVRNLRMPSIDLANSGRAAGMAAPALGTLADLLPALCVAAIGIIVFIVIRRMRVRTAGTLAVEELGPWPVDPSAVSSREDLIRAFDYLSQLRCGPAARAWHHRAVAARLGPDGAALADLYEQARYSPEADLPPPAFAEARSQLSRLAGAAA